MTLRAKAYSPRYGLPSLCVSVLKGLLLLSCASKYQWRRLCSCLRKSEPGKAETARRGQAESVSRDPVHEVDKSSRESIWLGEPEDLWNMSLFLKFSLLSLRGDPVKDETLYFHRHVQSGLFGHRREGWPLRTGEFRRISELYSLKHSTWVSSSGPVSLDSGSASFLVFL